MGYGGGGAELSAPDLLTFMGLAGKKKRGEKIRYLLARLGRIAFFYIFSCSPGKKKRGERGERGKEKGRICAVEVV